MPHPDPIEISETDWRRIEAKYGRHLDLARTARGASASARALFAVLWDFSQRRLGPAANLVKLALRSWRSFLIPPTEAPVLSPQRRGLFISTRTNLRRFVRMKQATKRAQPWFEQ